MTHLIRLMRKGRGGRGRDFLLKDWENVFVSLSPPLSKLAWLYVWHPKAEMTAAIEGNRRGMLTPGRD